MKLTRRLAFVDRVLDLLNLRRHRSRHGLRRWHGYGTSVGYGDVKL